MISHLPVANITMVTLIYKAQVLKVCRSPSPTACLKLLHKVCLKGGEPFHYTCPLKCVVIGYNVISNSKTLQFAISYCLSLSPCN